MGWFGIPSWPLGQKLRKPIEPADATGLPVPESSVKRPMNYMACSAQGQFG
jgi:hypothetical protein